MGKEMELVERFQDSSQAVMLRELLKGNGFDATIHGQGGMGGSGARLAGGFLVMAPKAEMPAVRRFLERLAKEAWQGEAPDGAKAPPVAPVLGPDGAPERCPHCGGREMAEIEAPAPLRAAMTILLLGLPLLFPRQRTWVCKACEQHWP